MTAIPSVSMIAFSVAVTLPAPKNSKDPPEMRGLVPASPVRAGMQPGRFIMCPTPIQSRAPSVVRFRRHEVAIIVHVNEPERPLQRGQSRDGPDAHCAISAKHQDEALIQSRALHMLRNALRRC